MKQKINNIQFRSLEDKGRFLESTLTAEREDGVRFFVEARMDKETLTNLPAAMIAKYVWTHAASCVYELYAYGDCNCEVGNPCAVHRNPLSEIKG